MESLCHSAESSALVCHISNTYRKEQSGQTRNLQTNNLQPVTQVATTVTIAAAVTQVATTAAIAAAAAEREPEKLEAQLQRRNHEPQAANSTHTGRSP